MKSVVHSVKCSVDRCSWRKSVCAVAAWKFEVALVFLTINGRILSSPLSCPAFINSVILISSLPDGQENGNERWEQKRNVIFDWLHYWNPSKLPSTYTHPHTGAHTPASVHAFLIQRLTPWPLNQHSSLSLFTLFLICDWTFRNMIMECFLCYNYATVAKMFQESKVKDNKTKFV